MNECPWCRLTMGHLPSCVVRMMTAPTKPVMRLASDPWDRGMNRPPKLYPCSSCGQPSDVSPDGGLCVGCENDL